jgi:hypothetical protein
MADHWTWTVHVKDLAQALGFAGAGSFFIYKAVSGYLRCNLAMTVSCDRQAASEGTDYLAIKVHLKKGPNGTMEMNDLTAFVTYKDHQHEVRFEGVTRSSSHSERISNTSRAVLEWKNDDATSPLLKLVPDEEIDLAGLDEVPTEAACRVQVCLLGRRLGSPMLGQWKCSTVSFPLQRKRDCNT